MISLTMRSCLSKHNQKKQKNYKSEIERLATENNKLEKLKNEFGSNPSIAGTLAVSLEVKQNVCMQE